MYLSVLAGDETNSISCGYLDKRHDQRHNMYNEIEPLQYNVDVI